tara:strand:- start:39 stop:404 length:366 start_codon:yes stop_codon:yes gene_type:complete
MMCLAKNSYATIGLYLRKAITNKTAIKQEIPAVTNAGKYVSTLSRVSPAANAANAEPIWCEEKIHPNNTGPFTGPKNCPANRTVGGTVAIKSNPKKIAHKVNEKTSKSLYGNQISDNPRKP